MKKSLLIALPLVLGLAACSFEKKGENPEQVPSAGTTEGVQPSAPEAEAPAEPTAPTPPEAQPPAQQ